MNSALHGVIDDAALKALRQRNEARAKAAREALGTLYVLHPVHQARRIPRAGLLPFPSHRLGGI